MDRARGGGVLTDQAPPPLPYDAPASFEIARCEIKKRLPADGDKAEAIVFKLGLIGPRGEKGYAELFHRGPPESYPSEGTKETLIVKPPKQAGWLPSAMRPHSGGGGGPRRRDPAETRAIQRQHSQEMALRVLVIRGVAPREDKSLREEIQDWTNWFEADISGGGQGG